ncbi:uncharacterized protein LOC113305359 [Papaver somniferum]|uniref:uncharacterized protein LOC113305359 n=1 Tax=Papaver somniferum TaxID=3469 RepID=UPI000E6F6845|nr:uncharacterized protein LOC113305359 [Papaver somniferum]
MAVQASMGISRILFMLGTGCTGTILVQKGQLSQILGSLQSYVKRLEGGSDDTDLVSQLSQITAAVRQIQLQRPGVTMITGSNGNSTTLIVPIASAGALVYGYMWWKGISFSDISYVTKESMAAAVSSLRGSLEQVTSGLNAAKRQLMNQLTGMKETIDGIDNTVQGVRKDDNKMDALDSKADETNAGIMYICSTVNKLEIAVNELKTAKSQQAIEYNKPQAQAIEYKPQPKFILMSTTNGLLTIMDSPKETVMDSPKELEQDSKVKPSISSAFSRKNTYMGISLVI